MDKVIKGGMGGIIISASWDKHFIRVCEILTISTRILYPLLLILQAMKTCCHWWQFHYYFCFQSYLVLRVFLWGEGWSVHTASWTGAGSGAAVSETLAPSLLSSCSFNQHEHIFSWGMWYKDVKRWKLYVFYMVNMPFLKVKIKM